MAFPFIRGMEKIIKLKENYEFRRAYTRGKSYVTPYFVIYLYKTKKNAVRLGVTTGKKIGGAVRRNRARRVLTAAFRETLPHIRRGYDVVLVARTKILDVKSTEAKKWMYQQWEAAGILDEKKTD